MKKKKHTCKPTLSVTALHCLLFLYIASCGLVAPSSYGTVHGGGRYWQRSTYIRPKFMVTAIPHLVYKY